MGVFSCTSDWTSAADAAASWNTHPGNAELFLNALCSLGLLQKRGGMFRNTEPAEAFLVEDTETGIAEFIQVDEQFLFQTQDHRQSRSLEASL